MKPDLRLLPAVFAVGLTLSGAALAQESGGPVLVELYTSQGCVSCPPADALLTELATRPDVLPLALHVDYWDYIGWEDTFGAPEFTRRQKTYAINAGERSVYTPQMVIAGQDHVVGFDPVEVARLIAARAGAAATVGITLARSGDMLSIRLAPLAGAGSASAVQLVRFRPEATVQILRGENAGKTVVYSNIVTSWDQIADWDGLAPLGLEVAVTGDEAVAVVIQSAGQGPVLAAARLD